MANTTSADMIVPEVYGDMAQAEFTGKVRVAGSPAVKEDNTLEGQPGELIHFPKWGALGELADLTEGTPITAEKLSTSKSSATIKEAGKGVTITDRSRLVGMGDPESEARRQFGILAARKVDADLITAASAKVSGSAPYEVTTTAETFGWDAVVDAIAAFGDEWEPEEFAGIYINSAQQAQAFRDDQFINASKLGAETAVRRGQIGVIGGVPVLTTNRIDAGQFLVVKNQALGLLYKRRPLVETERHALARSTDVVTTLHYAVKRLNDKGVAVGTLAVPAAE
ncbi:MAG: N4-gp56 family major capsid protein [Brachybacterium sp.]|uniref:N4-gp56 family major capsid protein n=1 Tax=Brachybacterium sp. TaxID=1891286 RepID=UPI0026480D81|nr:N4-gp56 family major capsid protein [Brachybacterium sp.]MDN5687012.1 N4-gp56 family major capsid protein [Brachybacterium sp.]